MTHRQLSPRRVRRAMPRAQRGQAMAETVVIVGSALLFAFWAINMIGHLSDVRDRTEAAARYAAWERTVYYDDNGWAPKYGNAATKSDAAIRSEIAQRVLGRGTKIDRADGTRNQLPSSEEPMWRDIAGNTILQKYGDLQVSHTVGGTDTVADKALNALGSLSGIGAGFDLPTKNQQSASVSLRVAGDSPSLVALWPNWAGVTFSDKHVLLTNTWTPDGSNNAKSVIAGAVPTAKGAVLDYALDVLAPAAIDITTLDLGRIQPDVVPADRLGNK